MIYTDQHVHCQSSPDSRTPLREMAAAARDRGMSAVCFTDHIDMDFGDLGDLRWETRKDILRAAWADIRENLENSHKDGEQQRIVDPKEEKPGQRCHKHKQTGFEHAGKIAHQSVFAPETGG